nr:hypothetical protein [Escherichia coli]
MIHSFKDRRLEKFFSVMEKSTAGIPAELINAISCRLETLNNVKKTNANCYLVVCGTNA